jgi:hypothetical protein
MSSSRLLVLTALVVAAVFSRLLPHPPNFTAIGAAAVFAGATLPWRWAMLVPLLAMVVGDAIIGFHSLTLAVYGCLVVSTLLGRLLKPTSSALAFGGMGALSAVVFFVGTNFAVWAFQDMYPRTGSGLGMCYLAALPFLANMIVADIVFAVALVTATRLSERYWPAVRLSPTLQSR